MPMAPHKGESQAAFMSRCVPEMMGDGKRPNDQAVAACLTMFRDKGKQKQVEPQADESFDEFMDRCVNDAGEPAEQCRLAWEQRSGTNGVIYKTHAAPVLGMEFVLSDESPDRMGDVIMANGWDLANFTKNPIALFNHNPDFIIGAWENVRIDKRELRGHLKLAPKGASPRLDEIRALIDAGILKASSVGFRPAGSAPRKSAEGSYLGQTFTKQELVEVSVVSVPANANALAVAKSLMTSGKISAGTLDLVFAKHGTESETRTRGGVHGKHAKTSRNRETNVMQLSQRITESQGRIVALRDQLTEHLKAVDDSNVTDAQLAITNDINAKIAQEQKGLDGLKDAERALGAASDDGRGNGGDNDPGKAIVVRPGNRPFAMPTKKIDPVEYIVRAGTVEMFKHIQKRSTEDVRATIAQHYPGYGDDLTKAYIAYIARAATNPAMTSVTGWAAELVETVFSAFMETLMPKSVFPRLSNLGLSLNFGRAGRISVPTRSRTPTIAGSFVGEGQPIPVRQGAFTAQILTPKKMAVITTWTREIDEGSVPAIEGLLRQAISEDTAVSLDSVLIDANPATTVRPAGLLNGVAGLTPTAGGGFNAIVGDIKQLTGALITATSGHLRSPAWLMNPQQVNSAGLIAAPGVGAFPFREELSSGKLQGYPIIDSGTVPMGTVILVDAADFVVAGGEAPRFEVSDQATLHEEDTTPLPIGSAGTPAVVAAPVRSLWQTDSLALRLILPVNWTLRRPGVVAWVAGVTW
jgi:HK97 family phage prohead protease/HK97 family phage major capsid protein